MIQAVAAYVGAPADSSPPLELQLARHAAAHPGALPEAGGLLDQPAGLLERVQYAGWVEAMVSTFRKAKSTKKWIKAHPGGWDLILYLKKLNDASAKVSA